MLAGSQSVGHPVDVATGVMHNTCEDIFIPGKVALEWSRFYSTALHSETAAFGPGWTNKYFCSLRFEKDQYFFTGADGSPITLADPKKQAIKGEIIRNLGAFTELWFEKGDFIIRQWDVESGEIWRYLFPHDKHGKLSKILPLKAIYDSTGQGLELSYDLEQRLVDIRQKLERRTLVLHYNDNNHIESIEFQSADKLTRQTLFRYTYDSRGRLVSATNAANDTDYYEYNNDNLITREATKDGAVVTFKYDNKGRCVHSMGLDGYDEKILRYIDNAGWTEVTDSLGHVRRFLSNGDGQILREIDPLSAEDRTEYDEHGRIVARINPIGHVTRYEYDNRGNRCKITNTLGQTTETTYNGAHQLLSSSNPAGNSWYWFYEQNGHWVALEDPEGTRHSLTYDDAGNLTQITDSLGNSLRQFFTAQGILESVSDWEGNISRYHVDAFGRMVELIDPLGNHTKYIYDAIGNLLLVDYQDGTRDEYQYDAANNLIVVNDRNGNTNRYTYGPCGRLLDSIDATGNKTHISWGTEPHRIETVTNAKGEMYRFEYDAVGRIVGEKGFDGLQLKYELDLIGNRVAIINGLDERIEIHNDALGRIVQQKLPDGDEASFSYDAAGFLEYASNTSSDIAFERDRLGRIVREIQNGYVINRRYDETGNLTQLHTTLGMQIDYKFDGNRLLTQFRVNGHKPYTLKRDARGSEIRRTISGQYTLNQSYDAMGRLTNQTVLSPFQLSTPFGTDTPVPLIERNYKFENAQLIGIHDKYWGNSTHIYDPVDRLTNMLREKDASERFQYDKNSNLINIEKGDDTASLTYAVGDRLESKDNVEFHYDEQGRLIQKTERQQSGSVRTWLYQWDALDQLRIITTPEGETWHYAYDPLGRRIEKRAPNGTRYSFVWDEDVVLHELHDSTVTASWVFDPHSFIPLCKVEESELYSVITDHLGTPRELVDNFGRVVWQVDYWAWGAVREQKVKEVNCPIRFQGQWWDKESGLHYNRFRYYDPEVGRFISQDPILLAGGLNLYNYVINPIMWIDMFGLVCAIHRAQARAAKLRQQAARGYRSRGGLPTTTSAVVDRRTGRVFYGYSGDRPERIHSSMIRDMPRETLVPQRNAPVNNCAEFSAVNKALLKGARREDLQVHTVITATGEPIGRCANCQVTTAGTQVTSD